MYLLIKRANFLASKKILTLIVSHFFCIENIMTRLPKKFDEFTTLKQFTIKFTGLTIEKKKGKPFKVAQNLSVLSPGAKSDRF